MRAVVRPEAAISRESSKRLPPSKGMPNFLQCFFKLRDDGRQREGALYPGRFCAAAHLGGAHTVTEQRADRVDDDRFTGAGFAGENIETSAKLDPDFVYQGEVLDFQALQHGAS